MKTSSRIITALLALLGFAGCDGSGGDWVMYGPGPAPEYGPRDVPFVVKGAVTDAEETPVEGVRVVLKLKDDGPQEGYDRRAFRDTVYTDANGKFETAPRHQIEVPWALIAADVDGAENGGEFEGEEKTLVMSDEAAFDAERGVYVHEIDFVLTEKENDDENE